MKENNKPCAPGVKGNFGLTSLTKSLLIISLIFLGSCGPIWKGGLDKRYDNSPIYIDPVKNEIERALESIHRIETITRFSLGDSIQTARAVGHAIALDEHNLLTAKHVVKIDSFRTFSPFGLIEVPIFEKDKVEEKSFIVGEDGTRVEVERIYTDDDRDFAKLRTGKKLTPFPFPMGNSAELRISNVVFLLGDFQTGFCIRMGNVTQLAFTTYGPNGEVADIDNEIIGISATTVGGDSGAPIVSVRDGKYELIGIVTFFVERARGLGYGLKINAITDRLKESQKARRSSALGNRDMTQPSRNTIKITYPQK